MALFVKVSGTWRTATAAYVKVAGTWRTAKTHYIKIAGTWIGFFNVVRAFSTLSTNYPDNKGAVMVGVQGSTLLRFSGESPFTNLAYKADVVSSPSTWTQVTNYPTSTQGAFGGIKGTTIWGIAGYPATTSVYGTSNLGTSWTTGASCSSSYWHAATSNGFSNISGDILKVGGFSSTVESYNGTAWTNRGSTPAGMGFGTLIDSPTRAYYTGGPGNESNSAAVYSYTGSAWTTETSQPVATRRTYGTALDGKIVQLGGEAVSFIYTYSGTGGSWAAGIAIGFGSTYTTSTVSAVAAYGSTGTTTWRYG